MDFIFAGLVLSTFYLNITNSVTGGVVGLLPDFLGYLFIVLGLKRLAGKNRSFKNTIPFAAVLAIYWFVRYVGAVVVWPLDDLLELILTVAEAVLALCVTFGIANGVKLLEQDEKAKLDAKALMRAWQATAIASVVGFAIMSVAPQLATAGVAMMLAAQVIYLVTFFLCRTKYRNAQDAAAEQTEQGAGPETK